MAYLNKKTMEIENLYLDDVLKSLPRNIGERITNAVLYGDPRGFGYAHPTGKEQFEAAHKHD